MSIAALLHLHQATEEGGAAADVGEAIGGEGVDAGAIGRELVPANGRGPGDTGADGAIDISDEQATAAAIEDAHAVACANTARCGVVTMQENGGSLLLRPALIPESGVHA